MTAQNGDLKAAEFRGKVLSELEYIKADTKEIKENTNSNSNRINKLENKWARATGIASGVGAAAGFIANLIFN